MTAAPRRRLASTALAVVTAALLCAGCIDNAPGRRDCTASETAQVATFERLAILRQHPASAQPADAYAGCGVDDSGDPVRPHAGQRYRSTLDEATIRTYYWAAMTADGWRNASTDIPPDVAPSLAFQRGVACLVKDVDGAEARVSLTVEPEQSTYTIEVVAGRGDTC